MRSALLASIVVIAGLLCASPRQTVLRLNNSSGSVSVRGYVGGESHDDYALALKAGMTIRITVSAKSGRVEFTVSDSPDFAEATPVTFLKPTSDRTVWNGTVPESKTYHLYVTAHPDAHYTLTVRVVHRSG